MYRARSSPAASNSGIACSAIVASRSVAPSGSKKRRTWPSLIFPHELAYAIARSRGPLGEGLSGPERVVPFACPEQGVEKVVLERDVDLGRGNEGDGALEQADRGGVVNAEQRPAGRRRPGASAPPAQACRPRASRALSDSDRPARGGSRGSRPARRGRRRAPRARRRSARGARRARPSAARRRRRPGSGGGESESRPRPRAAACSAGSAPCGRAQPGAG